VKSRIWRGNRRPQLLIALVALAALGCAERGEEPIEPDRLLVLELEPGYRLHRDGEALVSPEGERLELPAQIR